MSDWCSEPLIEVFAALQNGLAFQFRFLMSWVEASNCEPMGLRHCDGIFGGFFETMRPKDGIADIRSNSLVVGKYVLQKCSLKGLSPYFYGMKIEFFRTRSGFHEQVVRVKSFHLTLLLLQY